MDLSSIINFTIKFDLTAYPTLVLTDTSLYPDGISAKVWYEVQQPDGINLPTASTSILNPTLNVPLRLDASQKHQMGQYIIKMLVTSDNDTTTLVRTFEFTYSELEPNLIQDFDLFTPKLLYRDQTVVDVSGYTTINSQINWTADIGNGGAIGSKAASTSIFDLAYNGNYYSANYHVTYQRQLTYQHSVYAWLSVSDQYSQVVDFTVLNPPTISQMLDALNCMHGKIGDDCGCCGDDQKKDYVYAQTLVSHILNSIGQKKYVGLLAALNDFVVIAKECLSTMSVTNLPLDPFYVDSLGSGGLSTFTWEFDVNTPGITEFTIPPLKITAVISIHLDGVERKVIEGAEEDIPAFGTFIYVRSEAKFKYGGELNKDQWIKIKYR